MEFLVKPEILTSYIYGPISTFGNAESYPVSQLCVNTLPVTKVTLITNGV
jgi:hypothetical protein